MDRGIENQNIRAESLPTPKVDVYIPPCAKFCPVFERGNCVIDPRTQEMLIGTPETEEEKPSKQIIVFLGMPGAGKSTQVREVVEATGAPVYHMGKFAKSLQEDDPALRDEIQKTRAEGKLIGGLDEIFLAEVANDPSERVILDGFPRSIDQLVTLQDQALMNKWDLEVVYVSFPAGNAIDLSLQRQLSRHKQEAGEDPTEADRKKFEGKITRAMGQDMAVVEALLHTGVANVITLDGTKLVEEVTNKLRKELKLDFESLPFDQQTLSEVAEISSELGVESWLTGGAVYRTFWNNEYGPVQESSSFDVIVQTREEALRLEQELEARHPNRRWTVQAWEDEEPFTESLDNIPVNYRQAAVRMNNGKTELQLGEGVEADLRNGIIRLDEEALEKLPEDQRDAQIGKLLFAVGRQVAEYPGLRLEGRLAMLYEEKYGRNHIPVDIKTKWPEIDDEVHETEFGGRPRWSHQFTKEEVRLSRNVVDFFVKVKKEASAPPKPEKSNLPGKLENIREQINEARYRGDQETVKRLQEPTSAPEGYASWLHYACVNATDGEFREWLLNQIRSEHPVGGRDQTVQTIFNYEQFDAFTKNSKLDGEQKVTHQGWQLDMHLKEATFQLDTDEITREGSLPQGEADRARFAMRVALLYHDVGKLLNVNTPGSHEGVGAKLFLKTKPDWIPDDVTQTTAELIRLHDVFGRLSRGLCEKDGIKMKDPNFDVTATPSYKGALDPQIVRDEINRLGYDFETSVAMVKAVWTADVGSVASLRWLLPIADRLEKVILAGQPQPEIPRTSRQSEV